MQRTPTTELRTDRCESYSSPGGLCRRLGWQRGAAVQAFKFHKFQGANAGCSSLTAPPPCSCWFHRDTTMESITVWLGAHKAGGSEGGSGASTRQGLWANGQQERLHTSATWPSAESIHARTRHNAPNLSPARGTLPIARNSRVRLHIRILQPHAGCPCPQPSLITPC